MLVGAHCVDCEGCVHGSWSMLRQEYMLKVERDVCGAYEGVTKYVGLLCGVATDGVCCVLKSLSE